MNVIRIVLYVASALMLASAIMAVLPWGTLNAFMGWFGPFAYPDEPLVQYTVKVTLESKDAPYVARAFAYLLRVLPEGSVVRTEE